MNETGYTLNLEEIMALIPHRPPFLFLDAVRDLYPQQRAVGIKALAPDAPFFDGHYPGFPIMPGVLMVEAANQTAAVLACFTPPGAADSAKEQDAVPYLAGLDKVRFRKPVRPGDTLEIRVTSVRSKGAVGKFSAEIFVEGTLAMDAQITAVMNTK